MTTMTLDLHRRVRREDNYLLALGDKLADESMANCWRRLLAAVSSGHWAAAECAADIEYPWRGSCLYDHEIRVNIRYRSDADATAETRAGVSLLDVQDVLLSGGQVLDIELVLDDPMPVWCAVVACVETPQEAATVALYDLRGMGALANSIECGKRVRQWAKHSGIGGLNSRRREAERELRTEQGYSGAMIEAIVAEIAVTHHQQLGSGHGYIFDIVGDEQSLVSFVHQTQAAKHTADLIYDELAMRAYGQKRKPRTPPGQLDEVPTVPDELPDVDRYGDGVMSQWAGSQVGWDPTGEFVVALVSGEQWALDQLLAYYDEEAVGGHVHHVPGCEQCERHQCTIRPAIIGWRGCNQSTAEAIREFGARRIGLGYVVVGRTRILVTAELQDLFEQRCGQLMRYDGHTLRQSKVAALSEMDLTAAEIAMVLGQVPYRTNEILDRAAVTLRRVITRDRRDVRSAHLVADHGLRLEAALALVWQEDGWSNQTLARCHRVQPPAMSKLLARARRAACPAVPGTCHVRRRRGSLSVPRRNRRGANGPATTSMTREGNGGATGAKRTPTTDGD